MSLGLAPKMVDMVFDSLGRLKAEGVTMMIVEQFVHRALAFADQCVLLSRGQVAWQGPPAVPTRRSSPATWARPPREKHRVRSTA